MASRAAAGAGDDTASSSDEGSSDEEDELECYTRLATLYLQEQGRNCGALVELPLSAVSFQTDGRLLNRATMKWDAVHIVVAYNMVFLYEDSTKATVCAVFHLLGEYFSVGVVKYDSKFCVKLLQDGGGVDEEDVEDGRVISARFVHTHTHTCVGWCAAVLTAAVGGAAVEFLGISSRVKVWLLLAFPPTISCAGKTKKGRGGPGGGASGCAEREAGNCRVEWVGERGEIWREMYLASKLAHHPPHHTTHTAAPRTAVTNPGCALLL